jgi:Leucine Rich repeat
MLTSSSRIGEAVGRTTTRPALSDQLNRFSLHQAAPVSLQQQRKTEETLVNRCLQVIADNFETIDLTVSAAEAIPPEQIAVITNKLSDTISPLISAQRVHNETFWKRVCLNKYGWTHCHLGDHGMRWKQVYFEKMIRELLEECDGREESIDRIREVIKAASDYIFTIKIQQLPSHINLEELFSHAHNLTRIELCYSVTKIGMQYDRLLFGMKLSDAVSLEKVFKRSSCLTTVILSRNMIDDDLLRLLFVGLEQSSSITHLDLSHNKITDFGVQLLSKILMRDDSVLSTLNISDNLVYREGGRHLGRALSRNSSLVKLDLRLNTLGDEGCEEICRAMLTNETVLELHIGSNRASDKVRLYTLLVV